MNDGINQNTESILAFLSTSDHSPFLQIKAREYPLISIRFLEVLGEGAFGPIYRGELVNNADGNGAQIIVKSLRDGTSPDLLQVSIAGQIIFEQQTDGQMSALIIRQTDKCHR